MINILYEDEQLIVCVKPVGILSQPDANGSGEGEDMLSLLSAYLAEKQSNGNGKKPPYLALIHRLDRGVGGVMVFAKRQDAAAALSAAVANHTMQKEYLAVVHGVPQETKSEWRDYLYKDAAKGKSFVVSGARRGAKEAVLSCRLLETVGQQEGSPLSLLHILLHTGRTHQIRVQSSSRTMPLVGDGKYGAKDHAPRIGLWAFRLTFPHPDRKIGTLTFSVLPTGAPFDAFSVWQSPIPAFH